MKPTGKVRTMYYNVKRVVYNIEPTTVLAAGIVAAGLYVAAGNIKPAVVEGGAYTFQIQNEGRKPVVKAFKVEKGELVPVQ